MWAGYTAKPSERWHTEPHGRDRRDAPEPEQRLWQAVFVRTVLDALGARKARKLLGGLRGNNGSTFSGLGTVHDVGAREMEHARFVLRSGWWILLAHAGGFDPAVLLSRLRGLGLEVGTVVPEQPSCGDSR